MKCREIGDKVGNDGRDSRYKFSMNEANGSDTDNSKVRAKTEEPINRDLILDVEFVFLECTIVPYIHDYHENK